MKSACSKRSMICGIISSLVGVLGELRPASGWLQEKCKHWSCSVACTADGCVATSLAFGTGGRICSLNRECVLLPIGISLRIKSVGVRAIRPWASLRCSFLQLPALVTIMMHYFASPLLDSGTIRVSPVFVDLVLFP